MNRLLIVDSDKSVRDIIREHAQAENYDVVEASGGLEAIRICREEEIDIIVMDITLPEIDGFSACKEICAFKNIPILILSAHTEEFYRLFAFGLGINDYVTKPFSPKEIIARLNVILRRNRHEHNIIHDNNRIRFGGLSVDMVARTVQIDGTSVGLTPKEYDLLFYFVRNRNKAIPREKLLKDVWGYDFFGGDRTVDTHVKRLRNALGPYRKYIVTIQRVGYKFEATESI